MQSIVPQMRVGDKVQVPTPCLRFTHSGIDARMVFKHRTHAKHSVYELVDDLWREHISGVGGWTREEQPGIL